MKLLTFGLVIGLSGVALYAYESGFDYRLGAVTIGLLVIYGLTWYIDHLANETVSDEDEESTDSHLTPYGENMKEVMKKGTLEALREFAAENQQRKTKS